MDLKLCNPSYIVSNHLQVHISLQSALCSHTQYPTPTRHYTTSYQQWLAIPGGFDRQGRQERNPQTSSIMEKFVP